MRFNFKYFMIINKYTLNFLTCDGEEVSDIEVADSYCSVEEALEEIVKCDNPLDFEIRELNVICNLGRALNIDINDKAQNESIKEFLEKYNSSIYKGV